MNEFVQDKNLVDLKYSIWSLAYILFQSEVKYLSTCFLAYLVKE
jgi:hypothetical protein